MRLSRVCRALNSPTNVASSTMQSMLRKVNPVTYSKLDNGFRVATEHSKGTEFVTIGVWIDAGSRFESRENNGVAHYLEHLNFKGTKNYTRKDIENTFEYLGAHFNAYTARDRTAYYIKVMNKDADSVIKLLADIFQNGLYERRDIELERGTILAEMREVESLVDEVIMDNLHLTAFDADTCGLPLTILGPKDNIAKNIDRQMVVDYINTHYTGPRMALVSVGGLEHKEVETIAQKYFGHISAVSNRPKLAAKYVGGETHMWNDTMMTAHAAWAMNISGASHEDTIPLTLLQSIIGTYKREQGELFAGQAMNPDRPQLAGLESATPFYTPYEETGLLGYYFVTVPGEDRSELKTALNHSMDTFEKLANYPVTVDTLESAKAHFKAQQMIAIDSTTNSAEDLGRQLIHFGRRVPVADMFEKVDAATPESVMKTLHKYFYGNRPVLSCIGPSDALPAYEELLRVKNTASMA